MSEQVKRAGGEVHQRRLLRKDLPADHAVDVGFYTDLRDVGKGDVDVVEIARADGDFGQFCVFYNKFAL